MNGNLMCVDDKCEMRSGHEDTVRQGGVLVALQ